VEAGRALAALAASLVETESVNPGLAATGSGERAAAEVVAAWARAAGLEVELDEALPGRPNVLVTAPGTGGGRTLLLNGHLDTVGVAGMAEPFAASTRSGRLFGRGAYDMKGAVAAALVAAARAREEELAGDVVVACVTDEELASAGTERLLRACAADGAIVCEPTDERICVAHKGFAGFEVETQGRAAHGSRPDLGIDAIAAMGPVLTRLAELAARLEQETRHELLASASVHASLIEGGQEYSSYPTRCLLTGERRTLPGETEADIERELRGLIEGTGATGRVTFAREPFEIDPSHELPQLVLRAAGADRLHGIAFWTDAALLAGAGIPTVLYGPTGAGAHATEEWVELDSLERCSLVYLEPARAFCTSA
jgi:acetylornithine deacetylase/succinyl-diaminopimelate desuccinylase-like protein